MLNIASLRLIARIAWRHAWRRPLQSMFLVVGVAIGVAMIIAIDLANGSASRAFSLGTEQIAGRSTHQIVSGSGELPSSLYSAIRTELGYRFSAPVIESYVTVPELDAQPMRLLAIDPFAEAPFRSYLGSGTTPNLGNGSVTRLLTEANTILIGEQVAERYSVEAGETLEIQIGPKRHQLRVVGLLQPSDDLSRRALDGLLIADIATGQEVLDRLDRIDRIDLILAEGGAGEKTAEAIRGILPPGARLETSGARTGTIEEMTAAFSLNLTALSLLALVVGIFLIYNTVTFSVVQRRPVLGSLRALGMTRREIFGLILLESVLLSLLGTAGGLVLGVILGRGAVQAVTQTINDLFFVVAVRDLEIPTTTFIKGALSGLGAALLAAIVPAWEATSVAPSGALQRSDVEEKVRKALPRVSIAGLVLMVAGALLLLPDIGLVLAFAGLFALVIGGALLTPGATLLLMTALQRILRNRMGILARMAPRDIIRSLSRTSVAIAALMVAVSVIIGVGVMIGSFRLTVEEWLDDVLQADIFISAPALGASRETATLDPALADEVAGVDGVSRYTTNREKEIDARLPDGEIVSIGLAAVLEDLAGEARRYKASVGDTSVTWAAVEAGGVVINEPMANRFDLNLGQEITLFTDRGEEIFEIVGVAYDFDVRPSLLMAESTFRRFWDERSLSAIALFVEPDVDVDEKVVELRRLFAGRAELVIQSNRGTRRSALEIFDRTFAITVALQLLATLVAFIGILSTLMSLQLERAREIGMLRATGMTRRQLWKLTLLETGLIGTSAGLVAMPMGFLLALVLIYIINLRSFGWTLSMELQPGEFIQAFAVALVAALLAGIYPAYRMGRTQPADALRME